MIKQCLTAALLAAALCACGSNEKSVAPPDVAAATTVISSATLADIDSYVQAQMSKQHIPGLTVLVASNGTPILQKGYGLANIELNQAAAPDTIYHIGSVTKQFAAAGVMLLVQDGKLSLDRRIAQAASFGAVAQFGLVDSRGDNGVTTYRYLIKSHDDNALLLLELDAAGKVGAMYFN